MVTQNSGSPDSQSGKNQDKMMRSGLANTLRSFGTIFLGFGITFLIIGLLGVHFGTRPSLGAAGTLAIAGIVGGAILAGAGTAMGRSST